MYKYTGFLCVLIKETFMWLSWSHHFGVTTLLLHFSRSTIIVGSNFLRTNYCMSLQLCNSQQPSSNQMLQMTVIDHIYNLLQSSFMLLLAQFDKDDMIVNVPDSVIQGYLAASSFPNSLSICFFSLFIFFAMRFFRVNCSDKHITVEHFTTQQVFSNCHKLLQICKLRGI